LDNRRRFIDENVMLQLFIIVLFMIAGALASAILGFSKVDTTPFVIALMTSIGAVVGSLFGFFVIGFSKKTSQARSQQVKRAPSQEPSPSMERRRPPAPIRERIAQFTHKEVYEVLIDDGYKSKMPFWSALLSIRRIPPKTAAMIRASLIKIRRTIRGC